MTEGVTGFLPDVNVLVALASARHVHHRAAHEALASFGQWHTTPITETSLMRLLMNPAVVAKPCSAHEVTQLIAGFARDPRWSFLPDHSRLTSPITEIDHLFGHQQVTDFHLINLAAQHGVVLATFDASLVASVAPANRAHVRLLRA